MSSEKRQIWRDLEWRITHWAKLADRTLVQKVLFNFQEAKTSVQIDNEGACVDLDAGKMKGTK